MSISRQQSLKWDPKSVEIRTKSVEKTLEPLIRQVTTLVNHYNRQQRKGYCKKKAHQLVRDIANATKLLVEVGESIAEDFTEMREPMLEACKEAKEAGDTMNVASNVFANDPCNPQKRNSMVRAARALLSSVTRLLCVADMADVQRLLQRIQTVDEHLKSLVNIGDISELITSFKEYGNDLIDLARQSGQRQADLKNQRYRDEMAAARSSLKNSSRLLYTASKAYIRHPEADSALENRDFAINELDDALTTIGEVAQAYGDGMEHKFENGGSLALLFDELLAHTNHDSEEYYQKTLQRDIQSLVEEIVEGCSHIASTVNVTDSLREKIYAECRNIKNTLKILQETCVDPHAGNLSEIEAARLSLQRRTKDITKLIQTCIISSVVDSFLGTNVPLVLLVEAAEAGDIKEINTHAAVFLDHTAKIVEVADLACSICSNAEGIKMVKLVIQQIGAISQQVANSAATTAKYPKSKPARENMHMFRDTWLQQMALLTEAVDDITTIHDYLIISEQKILEDTNICVVAMQNNDVSVMNQCADSIRERVWRVDDIVSAEIKNSKRGEEYTELIDKCLEKMRGNDLSYFLDLVEKISDGSDVSDDEFEDSVRIVYQSFKTVCKFVGKRSDTEEEEHSSDQVLSDETDELSEPEEKRVEAYFLNEKVAQSDDDSCYNTLDQFDKCKELDNISEDNICDKFAVYESIQNDSCYNTLDKLDDGLQHHNDDEVILNQFTEEINHVDSSYNTLDQSKDETEHEEEESDCYTLDQFTEDTQQFKYTKDKKQYSKHPQQYSKDPQQYSKDPQQYTKDPQQNSKDSKQYSKVMMTVQLSEDDLKSDSYFSGEDDKHSCNEDYKLNSDKQNGHLSHEESTKDESDFSEDEIKRKQIKGQKQSVNNRDITAASTSSLSSSPSSSSVWVKEEKTPRVLQTMTNEQKVKINILAEGLEEDKERLMTEVGKWKEQGNEIIITVKRMCVIMMDLSNFTKGIGNLRTSMDVIKAAEKIAKYGSKLTELVQKLAQNCPHSHTKSDLLAYIQRITLYSHQLTVTARIKADVQMIGGETIIMDVETVKSLIETARNLMSSVMLTVRASYVASTKHRSDSTMTTATSSGWQMRSQHMKTVIDHSDYSSCASGSPSGYESDPRFFN